MAAKEKTRYIFYGHGRSGSSLLGTYINQHPDAHFDGELYHLDNLQKLSFYMRFCAIRFPRFYIRTKQRAIKKSVYGFSFLYYQFRIANITIQQMEKLGWKIIYLERDNDFDQIISREVAFKRKKWHTRTTDLDLEDTESEIFEVDKEDSLKRLARIVAEKKDELKILKDLPHFKMNYEKDLAEASQHQQTLDNLFNFLGLAPIKLAPPILLKTFNKPYSEIVSNYAEIKSAAIRTGLIGAE